MYLEYKAEKNGSESIYFTFIGFIHNGYSREIYIVEYVGAYFELAR
jgi:hypothetical protein